MLQFITHVNNRFRTPADGAEAALRGCCKWIQLRMKNATEAEIIAEGRRLRRLCDESGARLIIDDHAALVRPTGADGVHLGKNDMPVEDARRILGPKAIIGATANTFDDIVRAAGAGADYIGLGPFRFTTTKARLSPTLGTGGYRSIMSRLRDEGINLPVVAIGGITLGDVDGIMATGVSGIAISGAILNADDPILETQLFLQKL